MQRKSKIFVDLKTRFLNDKKGQLGFIEMKFFFIGVIVGIILLWILVALGNSGSLPFRLPLCPICK